MIETFKIQNNFDQMNSEILFEMNNVTVTRGNSIKLKLQSHNTIIILSVTIRYKFPRKRFLLTN